MTQLGMCPACGNVSLVDVNRCMLPHVGSEECKDTCYATGLAALPPTQLGIPLDWRDDLVAHGWPRL